MHGNSALDDVPTQSKANRRRSSSVLTTLLASLAFSFATAAHADDTPPVVVTPTLAAPTSAAPIPANDAAAATAWPTLGDMAAMLRAQCRVAPMESMKIARAVLTEADRHAISPVLLLAVMSVESSFNRYAVSIAGARGLMQVLPAAHPRLIAGTDLSDPAINVRIGSTILRSYLDESGGDLDAALLRYSGGGRGYARRVVLRMQSFDASLRRE
jgi:soluble lytic murein transglycosylase-like protein